MGWTLDERNEKYLVLCCFALFMFTGFVPFLVVMGIVIAHQWFNNFKLLWPIMEARAEQYRRKRD